MSNLDKWNSWYASLPSNPSAFRYGDTCTYGVAADFLADCATVEDRGCGAGGFLRYRPDAIGVDGSDTPFAQIKADLAYYTSSVDGILLRHVIEHDHNWYEILRNAVFSARRKLCLVLFTPFSTTTRVIAENAPHGCDVPDISFSRADIEWHFIGLKWQLHTFKTDTGYGQESVYLVEKPSVFPL